MNFFIAQSEDYLAYYRKQLQYFERCFRLRTATLAIAEVSGKRKFRFIDTGSLLKVISRCDNAPNAMVDVRVNGDIVEMFAVDVRERSDEVSRASNAA